MVSDEKGHTKNMCMKRNQKSNHCARNVLQCRILKASKIVVNGAKLQTTAQWLEQAPTGVMQKQENLLSLVKISFSLKLNICSYLWDSKIKNKNMFFPKL